MKPHVMIDIETLGLFADSVIVEIGACRFDERGLGSMFSVDVKPQAGRVTYCDTLKWWEGENPDRLAGFYKNKVLLQDALIGLFDYLSSGEVRTIWCNGADIDFAVLRHAIKQYKMPLPWKYGAQRDFRTMREMFGENLEKRHVDHDALFDAISQAEQLQDIVNERGWDIQ